MPTWIVCSTKGAHQLAFGNSANHYSELASLCFWILEPNWPRLQEHTFVPTKHVSKDYRLKKFRSDEAMKTFGST